MAKKPNAGKLVKAAEDLARWTKDAQEFAATIRETTDPSEWHMDVPTNYNDLLDVFLPTFTGLPSVPVRYRKQTDTERRESAPGVMSTIREFMTSPQFPLLCDLNPHPRPGEDWWASVALPELGAAGHPRAGAAVRLCISCPP